MPYLRRSEEEGLVLEVWAGVPPKKSTGPALTGIFELPETRELAAGKAETLEAVLKRPLTLTEHFSSASKPLEVGSDQVKARLIVGYGASPISPVHVDRIDKLLEWQATVTSEPFELPIR
jgi:hypothetical protein